jgi:hypothetical protein
MACRQMRARDPLVEANALSVQLRPGAYQRSTHLVPSFSDSSNTRAISQESRHRPKNYQRVRACSARRAAAEASSQRCGVRGEVRTRYIRVLLPAAADDSRFQSFLGAFLQELARLGWTDGRNVQIDTRWTSANAAEIRRHARELAELAHVILAHADSAVGPLLQATRTKRMTATTTKAM